MTEQQPYRVIRDYDGFELRRYPAHLVAEVTIEAAFDDAGNRAFRFLFGYISGENRSRSKVAMTAPVVQAASAGQSVEIAMTAPVVQQRHDATVDSYRVAFVLPADLTAATAPEPTNPAVTIRTVPESTSAAVRFSGRWSEAGYRRHLDQLRTALAAAGLVAVGAPRYARFDPPYLPPFLRRNEVVLDVIAEGTDTDDSS